ncbi:MAG: cytidine/deoxycytidylate deaminase family protein [Candidatus Latescibacterota bacterium]|nr:cytidine/deoxycytidylate deaminase family protein [Candidatus Latescibacterota bacterium]
MVRPNWVEYYMNIAIAVRARANCIGNRVGALLVQNGHIISTGYNGTPHGTTNCTDGGCHRCVHREEYESGKDYDLCICVHAEQNTLLSAARFGISTDGAVLYSTMQPCFGCTKELLQAQVQSVYYLHPWIYPDPLRQKAYEDLITKFPDGLFKVQMQDPNGEWAVSSLRPKT